MKSGGRIIMIGSAVGERVAAPGLVPYAGTKGAVKMFTQALAREIGSRGHHGQQRAARSDRHGIESRLGWTGRCRRRAATSLDRYGHVDEVAALVAFVAGPESSYITGANLTVDGGMKRLNRPGRDVEQSEARWQERPLGKLTYGLGLAEEV